jgi:hypothetical protein
MATFVRLDCANESVILPYFLWKLSALRFGSCIQVSHRFTYSFSPLHSSNSQLSPVYFASVSPQFWVRYLSAPIN